MNIIELTIDNIPSCIGYIPADVADNIGRIYYYGLLAEEWNGPKAAMIWELRNNARDSERESRIVWFRVDEEEAAAGLLEKYNEAIRYDRVKRSSYVIPAKVNSIERRLLKAAGFDAALTEGDEISASLEQIAQVPLMQKIPEDKAIRPLWEALPGAFTAAVKRMVGLGQGSRCEDLVYLPRMYFDNDVSCYYAQEEGQITGLFLFHRLPSGNLKVMMIGAVGKDYNKLLVKMMKVALSAALTRCPADTRVVIDRHNYAALALGEKLFPNVIGMPVYEGSRTESE